MIFSESIKNNNIYLNFARIDCNCNCNTMKMCFYCTPTVLLGIQYFECMCLCMFAKTGCNCGCSTNKIPPDCRTIVFLGIDMSETICMLIETDCQVRCKTIARGWIRSILFCSIYLQICVIRI